jgi:pullulanase/glycogen debranching enzyme
MESGSQELTRENNPTLGGARGYLLLLNPGQQVVHFELPALNQDPWQVVVDTSDPELEPGGHDVMGPVEVRAHSLKVLRRVQVRVGVIRSLLPA